MSSYMVSVMVQDAPLERVCDAIEVLIDETLEHRKGDGFDFKSMRIMGMELSVMNDHELVDDGPLKLSSYKIIIDVTEGLIRSEPRHELIRALCRMLAQELAEGFSTECLVVQNLQTRLETYSGTQSRT
jgi:hypothetical protein